MEAALSLVREGPPPANGQPEGRPCAAELTHSESPQQRNYIRFWNAVNTSIGRARLVFPYPPDPAEPTLPLVEQVCES